MNAMPKYVVSSTLTDAEATWHDTTVLRGDAVAELTRLRTTVAGNILVAGSASLVHLLVEHGLVDELRLMVFPIVLGSGKRLFGDVVEAPMFGLDEVTSTGDVVMLTYHRVAAGDEGSGAA
jgi:dihydrofolate reductase